MFKKITFFLLLAIMLFGLSGCQSVWKPSDDNGKIIFYYSLTCPHCKKVEQYFADNGIRAKVKFEEKEVSQNKDNAAQFYDKISRCNIPQDQAGVPLLWDGSTCIVGDEPIISYFFNKTHQNANSNTNLAINSNINK